MPEYPVLCTGMNGILNNSLSPGGRGLGRGGILANFSPPPYLPHQGGGDYLRCPALGAG